MHHLAGLLLVLSSLAAGCAKPHRIVVPLGWRGALEKHECYTTRQFEPAGRVWGTAPYYEAVGVGVAKIQCTDDEVVEVEVRRIARLKVETPTRLKVGIRTPIKIAAYDDHGDRLKLDDLHVDWTVSGPLALADSCSGPAKPTDFPIVPPTCFRADSQRLTANEAGTGTVTVDVGGQQASVTIVAAP